LSKLENETEKEVKIMGSAISTLGNTPEVRAGHNMDWPISETGFVVEGELYHISPLSVSKNNINMTSFPGKCSGTLFSLLFWFGKAGYSVHKIEDAMEVSAMDVKYYQITMQQKQALERQIKDGLAGVSSAITDFELLFHDLRKYKDFLNYFMDRSLAIETKNDELLAKTEQSLKAVFIDQVDVHTGEGVALKLIAPRWPTIISDFMRIKDKDTNPKNIGKDYKVSEAEGVVLATKNKLYQEWRESFEKIVKERYERVLGMVKSRKFSIDEYKTMMKPYVERYMSIHEAARESAGRGKLRALSWLSPGAQATSFDWLTFWAFKAVARAEPARVSYEATGGRERVLKMPFSSSFKSVLKKNMGYLKDNGLHELKLSPTGIEPFDKWVWALYRHIEDYYTKKFGFPVRFTLAELLEMRNSYISGWGGASEPYFKCFDCDVDRAIIRLPDSVELEDITFDPLFFLDTQNMMLLRWIEIQAKNKAMELYINQMLGDTTKERKLEELESEYEGLFGAYGKKIEKKISDKSKKEKQDNDGSAQYMKQQRIKLQPQVMKEVARISSTIKFTRRDSHYEAKFDDVVTGPYFTDIGGSMIKVWNFIKAKFDVPGSGIAGLK